MAVITRDHKNDNHHNHIHDSNTGGTVNNYLANTNSNIDNIDGDDNHNNEYSIKLLFNNIFHCFTVKQIIITLYPLTKTPIIHTTKLTMESGILQLMSRQYMLRHPLVQQINA